MNKKDVVQKLEALAQDLRLKNESMVVEVRNAAKKRRGGLEKAIQAIHSYSLYASLWPANILKLALELKSLNEG